MDPKPSKIFQLFSDYSSENYDFKSSLNQNKDYNTNSNANYNYSNDTYGNDFKSTFNKYSKGGEVENLPNLEENLEMKYSMTQDLYDNKKPSQ